ncbi:MAG: hypothetical protein ACKVU2_18000 [Saprospiraceae bacterium]
MPNGDGISPGKIHDGYCKSGYPAWQGNLILPWPGHENNYIFFHTRTEGDAIKTELLYSIVDMALDAGMGDVGPVKNQSAIDDTLANMLTAVRHGNGRDWWVIIPRDYGNAYYTLLLSPSGLSSPSIQWAGESWGYEDWSGQSAFSPDGSWYARANPYNELHLFRFDRCSGLLSQPLKLILPDPDLFACGVAFSPNSQRLYVSTGLQLYQYDLTMPNVAATRTLIGKYDGFDVTGLPTTFFQMMLAPNGNIYMTCTSTVNVLHVIHNPDSLGLACDFRQHDLLLPTRNHWRIPNFPHFRLYDLPGSPCDSLGINGPVAAGEPAGAERARLAVWPNPAQASCTVQLMGEDMAAGRWALYSSAGQEVLSGVWPVGQGSQEIGLEGVAAGLYHFVLRTENGRVLAERVVVW